MAIGEHEQVLAERLKAALDTLEAIAADRTLLQELSEEERTRLAAKVYDCIGKKLAQAIHTALR